MAVPLAVKAIFRSAIPEFIKQGYSFRRAYTAARSWGISYRREAMLSDWQDYQGYFAKEPLVSAWPRDKLPTPYIMREASLRRLRRYRVWGEAEWYDPLTGATNKQMMSIYDDEARTLEDWEDMFQRERTEAEYKSGLQLIGIEFKMIEHQKGARY